MEHPGTYQTRISEYVGIDRALGDGALGAYAELVRPGGTQAVRGGGGRPCGSFAEDRAYLRRYGIPARMFNGVRVSLEGKVASVREQQKLRLDSLGRQIDRAGRQTADAAERGQWSQVHQKRRRLANLRFRLAGLKDDIDKGRVRLCFGSKRVVAQAVSPGAERLLQP